MAWADSVVRTLGESGSDAAAGGNPHFGGLSWQPGIQQH